MVEKSAGAGRTGVERTAGALLVAQLEALGVPRVYGVPGESYLEVLDALHDSPIDMVVCRQEGGAGFMALAEARLTGRPGVVAVTRGPGAANAAIAVHTAWQDATPMVLLVGLIPVADRDRESFQEFSLGGWFGTTAKRVITLDRPERAAEQVAEAFAVATAGRPGPVVIGLPEDVLTAKTAAPVVPARAVSGGAVSAPQAEELEVLLGRAERPLVIVGGTGWTADAAAAVTAWCERRRFPVVADWRCQDMVDHDSPAYAGWFGYGSDPGLLDALDRADLLLFVGGQYGDVLSGGYTRGNPDAPTVVVSADPDLRAHQRRVDLHLLATPAAFAGALPEGPAADPVWWEGLRAARERFATPGVPVRSEYVDLDMAVAALAERMTPDAIVAHGAGQHAIWAQRFLPRHSFPSLLAPRNGAMGYGLPAAVAASLVHPGRQVVCVAGDGCFLMNGQELATAAAYGATPLVVIADNSGYGTIRQHQRRHHPGRPSGTALVNPDFGALARSFGLHGERLSRTEDVPAALDRALAAVAGGRAAVLHLDVDPEILQPRGV